MKHDQDTLKDALELKSQKPGFSDNERTMSSNATIAALEQKYIPLLEKKIAKLESADGDSKDQTPALVGRSVMIHAHV